jgi:hypothetical protein
MAIVAGYWPQFSTTGWRGYLSRCRESPVAKLEAKQAGPGYTNGACPGCSNLADGLRRFE